jgi:hypothetical protein
MQAIKARPEWFLVQDVHVSHNDLNARVAADCYAAGG